MESLWHVCRITIVRNRLHMHRTWPGIGKSYANHINNSTTESKNMNGTNSDITEVKDVIIALVDAENGTINILNY